MISKQSIYLDADRKKAVAEGDKDGKFLLVRAGHEVNELEKYEGAEELAATESKVKVEPRLVPAPNFKQIGDNVQPKESPDKAKETAPAKVLLPLEVVKPRAKKKK